eukprot:RCo003319
MQGWMRKRRNYLEIWQPALMITAAVLTQGSVAAGSCTASGATPLPCFPQIYHPDVRTFFSDALNTSPTADPGPLLCPKSTGNGESEWRGSLQQGEGMLLCWGFHFMFLETFHT